MQLVIGAHAIAGQSHLMFSDSMRLPPAAQRIVQGPRPGSPSATSISSQSFASATSAELQNDDLQEQDPGEFGPLSPML